MKVLFGSDDIGVCLEEKYDSFSFFVLKNMKNLSLTMWEYYS